MTEIYDSMKEDDEDIDGAIFHDAYSDMTYGRRISLFLGRYSWYYPHAKALAEYEKKVGEGGETVNQLKSPPDLDQSWAYFEHNTLARYVDQGDKKGTRRIAPPGDDDEPTKLYPFFSTPEADMADWGVGVALYFQNLRSFAVICFIAGLITLPNMIYYSSDDYGFTFDTDLALDPKYSALQSSQVCNQQIWRACPTCEITDWNIRPYAIDRFATATSKDNEDLKFILQNECDQGFQQGILMWVANIFVALAVAFVGFQQMRVEIKYDEAEQTASDYTVQVDNSPLDSHDPEEWKSYFETNFTSDDDAEGVSVTAVTIALDNQVLIDKLIKRRNLLHKLKKMMIDMEKFDENDLDSVVAACPPIAGWKKLILRVKDAQTIKDEICTLLEEIKTMQGETHDVSHVFVTFETEADQRVVLSALAVPKSALFFNRLTVHSNNPNYLFRGNIVLGVSEPFEPSTIRWRDLDESIMTKLIQQACTYFLTFVVICIAGFIVYYVISFDIPLMGPYVITIMNQVVPRFILFLLKFEAHESENSFQASHYLKIALFRFVNTVLVLTVITPFTDTLAPEKLIALVCGLYFSEVTTIPVINYLDIGGTLKRHVFGPRKDNQKDMNLCFKGAQFYLADVYTAMSKLLFLCFWYANLCPAVYFLTAIALMVHYVSYKFALLRTYRRGPRLGTNLAIIGRVYIFPIAVLLLFIQADYNWTSFPFDNVCEASTNVTKSYIGEHNIQLTFKEQGELKYKPISEAIEILSEDENYSFCHQDMYNRSPRVFPAFPKYQGSKEWLDNDEKWISIALSWSAIAMLVYVGNEIVIRRLGASVYSYFYRSYKTSARAIDTKFSAVPEIKLYVPMMNLPGFTYPLLMCDISGIGEREIGWEDNRHGYDCHNLVKDVINDDQDSIPFSIVKYWPHQQE